MTQSIYEWLQKETNINYKYTDYTQKSIFNLLSSLVLAPLYLAIGTVTLGVFLTFGSYCLLMRCVDAWEYLYDTVKVCAGYNIKAAYELFATTVDLLATPFNMFRDEPFKFGKFLTN